MSIKRTIITTIVALAMVATIAPVSANATTIEELLAQIATLQSQLTALQGSSSTTTTSSTGLTACAGVTFSRALTVGSTGSDVKCLQQVLNSTGYTIATTGAGSPGSETTYFGSLTLAAVKNWQVAQGWAAANQIGPLSRAKLNSIIAGTSSTTTTTTTTTNVPTGSGLTVALASDNPASGTIVDGQALASLAKLVFVNGDNAEVKITSLKLKRIGISADATLTNVYLFDGARRLTDAASVSSTMMNFNDSTGVFTIPANSSKTISVLADVDGSTGETIGVQLVASTDITTNASSVKGTYPITGNYFTLASGTTLATIYMADETGTTTPATAQIDPQNDYAIWYDSMVVGTRAVNLQRIAFRVGGSISRTSDVKNFRLLIDGVQAGSAVATADSNDYVTFDLTASPVKLETGTRVIKVLADIIGGSNKNVYLSLRTAADVSAVDSQIGATLLLHRYTSTGSFTAEDSGTQSINSGTLTVTKMTTSPSGNVVDQANNVVLAKYELKAAGERVKIESLRVSVTTDDVAVGQLRNGAVYANGVQIGSTTDIEAATDTVDAVNNYTTYNFGSSLMVEPGSPVTLEVRADIYDNDGTNTSLSANTIYATIVGGDLNNAYGTVSFATVDVPSASVNGNTVTVSTGSVVLSKYTAYTDQNAVAPLTDYKLAHFTLTAGTTEGVNINTIYVYLNYVSGNVSNLYVKVGDKTTAVKAAPTAGTSRSADSWSVNYAIAAGQTVDVMVYGNVDSNASGSATTGVYMTGTTASSATAVTAGTIDNATTGQTISFTSGTWATAVDGSTPLNQIVSGGQTVTAAKFKLTASNDSYTLKEVRFAVPDTGTYAASAVINSLILKDGSTILATVPYNSSSNYFNVTGLSLAVPANTSKVLTVDLSLVTPYTNGLASTAPTVVTTGKDVAITMNYVKVANSQGAETAPVTSKTGNYIYVYKSIPTLTVGTVPSTQNLSTGGSLSLYNFNVAADSKGSVSLKQIKLTATVTDATAGGTPSLPYIDTLKFFRGSTDITTSVTIQSDAATPLDLETTTNTVSGSNMAIVVTFNTEETIPAGSSYSYTLKGNCVSFAYSTSGGDAVSVTMPSDSDSTAGGSTGAAQTHYFVYGATDDTSVMKLATSAAGAGASTANIIWSDNSAQSHDYTHDASSSDWFNGYLVLNLPLDTIGQSAK